MSDRQPPSEFTKAAVQGAGMLALSTVGLFLLTGIQSGSVQPADIVADIPAWRDTVLSYIPIVLGSAAALLIAVLAAVLATRYGRTMVNASASAWWRYKRRWDAVMADVHLTGKAPAGARTPIPALRGVAVGPDADVLTVTMLPGQTPTDWHHAADSLAAAFGATSGRIQLTAKAGSDIDLILEHSSNGSSSGDTDHKALPAPATATVPGLVLDPAQAAGKPRRDLVAMHARAWSLHIVCARIRIGSHNSPARRWFSGRALWGMRVRWGMIDRSGYYLIEGA